MESTGGKFQELWIEKLSRRSFLERNDGHFPFWRYAIWGLLLVVLIFIGFYILITHVDRSEYQKIVDLANNNVSFLGMCIYIWATDTFVLPLSPMFVFPFIVEYPWYFAIPFTGLSSALGGMTAYFIGFVFSKFPFIRRMTDKAYQKWGNVIRKYGLMCVLLSSLLPPYEDNQDGNLLCHVLTWPDGSVRALYL